MSQFPLCDVIIIDSQDKSLVKLAENTLFAQCAFPGLRRFYPLSSTFPPHDCIQPKTVTYLRHL